VVWKLASTREASCSMSRCVRTIVVWKREYFEKADNRDWLRENHSGMETEMDKRRKDKG